MPADDRYPQDTLRNEARRLRRNPWEAVMTVSRPRCAILAASVALALSLVPAETQEASGETAFRAPPVDFAAIVAQAAPSVVAIATRQVVLPDDHNILPQSHASGFDDFAVPLTPELSTSMGSGFFVSTKGHIVTNNHVIENAVEIDVVMDGGIRRRAEVVGTDVLTDLAVLKIEAQGATTPAVWGDSEALRPGAWTIAVGSPFGLGRTVTIGILSARQRDIAEGPFDEFLQTDAAINVGNSGGPLINAAGEVIGVNTAIFSPTGASVGIGFAVPSGTAERVVAELIEAGAVRRGFIGAELQDLDPVLARAFGYKSTRGALISDIEVASPAERAGLHIGDVVLRFNDTEIAGARDLSLAVADAEPGESILLSVLREGHEELVLVQVGQREPPQPSRPVDLVPDDPLRLGLSLRPLPDAVRQELGLEHPGVIVQGVHPGGLGAVGGVRQGDLILEAGRTPVGEPEDVDAAWEAARLDARPLLLQILRGHSSLFVAIEG